ncbi:MAG: penicillin-binding protein 2 [Gammaproteobacteria bacterium]|nr:penicillin-binding protein 2 [Gammaproteobacteria bacterium]
MFLGKETFCKKRYKAMIVIFIVLLIILVLRLLFLVTFDRSFLLKKSLQQADHPRIIPASRGVIFDRNGVPLAISAPIDNIIIDGKVFSQDPENIALLAQNPNLGLSIDQIKALLAPNPRSRYIIAKKNLPPNIANNIDDMNIPGVSVQRNQQSFYPEGPAFAQFIGFTDVNDAGQSGLELSYNHFLAPIYGRQSVTESALGQTYSINHLMKAAQDGHDLTLSIDSRLQYVAYQAVAAQVIAKNATWGGAVILDPHTGEVLAAVSYPSFNPNSMTDRSGSNVKDQVITDQLEPGSSMKPVTITEALASGQYSPTTPVDTNPGFYYVDGIMDNKHKVHDDDNFGMLTVTSVITKSSNIGISKIGLSLPRQALYNTFLSYGLGKKPTGGKYPGEASGFVYPLNQLGDFQFATMMFGYSISASLLQMARLYAAIANDGVILPLSYVKLDKAPDGTRIMTPQVDQQMIKILETVTSLDLGGTGFLANVPGYVVAGKTGTAHVYNPKGGYFANQYDGFFVGMIPANNPKLIIAVVMTNVKGYNGMGGIASAPVFGKIALAAMHILGIKPSNNEINLKIYKKTPQQLIQAAMEA